jgi:hypothetical protein
MTTPYLPQTMSDIVIDLNHWEAPVDFAQINASGIVAVILKATQGTGFVDPTFAARAVAAMPRASSSVLITFSTFPIPRPRRLFPRHGRTTRRPDGDGARF